MKQLPSAYDTKQGRLILTLQPAYLNGLSAGEHTLNFRFRDGAAAAVITIQEPPEALPTESPTPNPEIPKTGDGGNLSLWLMLFLMGLAGVAFIFRRAGR